jgi:hypothetical protein
MMSASYYDPATGAFSRKIVHANSEAVLTLNTPAGLTAYIGQVNPATQRFDVVTGEVVDRAACPVLATISGTDVALAGVPLGAMIRISGDVQLNEVNTDVSGDVLLSFGVSGHYQIGISCFPALDYLGAFDL